MSKTMENERDAWVHNRKVVTSFSPAKGVQITVVVEAGSENRSSDYPGAFDDEKFYYTMIRTFDIGGDWVTSVDAGGVSAHEIIAKMGDYIGRMPK